MDFLSNKFEIAIKKVEDHVFFLESIQAGYTKLLKYWNKQRDLMLTYVAAFVLDPTVKWSNFDDWGPEWQPMMKSALRTFWKSSYHSSTAPVSHAPFPSATDTTNEYPDWRTKKRRVNANVGDELERYLDEPLIPSLVRPALECWLKQTQRDRLSLLSKMAIDIYSDSALSPEPERFFFHGQNTRSQTTDASWNVRPLRFWNV